MEYVSETVGSSKLFKAQCMGNISRSRVCLQYSYFDAMAGFPHYRPFCGESTDQWIHFTKGQWPSCRFSLLLAEQTVEKMVELSEIWDVMLFVCRHCSATAPPIHYKAVHSGSRCLTMGMIFRSVWYSWAMSSTFTIGTMRHFGLVIQWCICRKQLLSAPTVSRCLCDPESSGTIRTQGTRRLYRHNKTTLLAQIVKMASTENVPVTK